MPGRPSHLFFLELVLNLFAFAGVLDDNHPFPDTDEDLVPNVEACGLELVLVQVDVGVVIVPCIVFDAGRTQFLLPDHRSLHHTV